MLEKVDHQLTDTSHIRRKVFGLFAPNLDPGLKAFLDDRDGGTSFLRLFECSRLDNQFKVAAAKQLLLCLESPDSHHLFLVPEGKMLFHVMHEWRSVLNDLNLLYAATLSRVLMGFRGGHGRPTTIQLRSLDQVNSFRGFEIASAVFYTASDSYCRFAESPELQAVRCRVRAGSCPQIAVVGSQVFDRLESTQRHALVQ